MKQISKTTKAANLDIFKAGSEVCFYMGQEQVAGHSAPFYVSVARSGPTTTAANRPPW